MGETAQSANSLQTHQINLRFVYNLISTSRLKCLCLFLAVSTTCSFPTMQLIIFSHLSAQVTACVQGQIHSHAEHQVAVFNASQIAH